jgi:hypothetical protein
MLHQLYRSVRGPILVKSTLRTWRHQLELLPQVHWLLAPIRRWVLVLLPLRRPVH